MNEVDCSAFIMLVVLSCRKWFDTLVKRIADPMGLAVGMNTRSGLHLATDRMGLLYGVAWSRWAVSWKPQKLMTERTLVLFHDKLDVRADHLARLFLEP